MQSRPKIPIWGWVVIAIGVIYFLSACGALKASIGKCDYWFSLGWNSKCS